MHTSFYTDQLPDTSQKSVVTAGKVNGPLLLPITLFWLSSILVMIREGSTGDGDDAEEDDASVLVKFGIAEKSKRVNDMSYWIKSTLRILGRGSVAVRGRRI